MIVGLAAGVVALLVVWFLWRQTSNNQASHQQTAEQQPPPQTTVPQPQPETTQQTKTTVPQAQTAVPQTQPQTAAQQPKSTGRKPQPQKTEQQPQPPAADVEKPVAKNCPEGVYCDKNLMWTMEDNGKDITWQGADQYCRSLTLAGLSGWELPTIVELAKLYDPQSSNVYNIRGPFRLTACCPWSSTKEGSGSAWFFSFDVGGRYSLPMGVSVGLRALCVRRSGE